MQRRRAIRVLASAAGLACLPAGLPLPTPWRWRGSALGAEARIDLWLDDPADARRLIATCIAEVDRLERIFSLHRADSALSRLNRDGRLDHPPFELTLVLETAARISALTDGAFDVTVQPLWRVFADHFWGGGSDRDGPDAATLERLRPLVDHRAIEVRPSGVRFAKAGMAATLNGIAQGLIADRVATLLQDAGLARAFIDVGEIRALGSAPGGDAWPVRAGADGALLALTQGAVATSSPSALTFDGAGRLPHLLDPATLRPASAARDVTVVAGSALVADALSTALAIRPGLRAPSGLGVQVVQFGTTTDPSTGSSLRRGRSSGALPTAAPSSSPRALST